MKKIFVDGDQGTTGLVINERLSKYTSVEILKIDPAKRKDMDEKKKLLNEADVVFLCLPDEAAKASVELIENDRTKVIDASTAHRINPNWVYGLPELSPEHREAVKTSKRVANPGCHATAVNLALYPLIKEGIVAADYDFAIHSITGYSGGGKRLIEKYSDQSEDSPYNKGPRHYSLNMKHKHQPEMVYHSGLTETPLFTPIVGNFFKGLVASIPLKTSKMKKPMAGRVLQQFYADYYKHSYFVRVNPYDSEEYLFEGCFDISGSNESNFADIFVFSDDDDGNIMIMCRIDNLGKGASGAALQNMNIMLGYDEWTNLV